MALPVVVIDMSLQALCVTNGDKKGNYRKDCPNFLALIQGKVKICKHSLIVLKQL